MEVVFTFASTLAAINGEAALLAAGLAVKVMPRPAALGEGCGLCLRLPEAQAEIARRLLSAADLEPEGLFDRLEDGGGAGYRPRELPLWTDPGGGPPT